jgi:enoyl-CoA hydratase/carnithine racemase
MAALVRERLDAGIEVLRLDRPQARNALDSALLAELEGALAELAADDELRVLVVSTTDTQALCAGADVAEQLDADGGVARMEAFARLYRAVDGLPCVSIAVCVGHCVGAGAEIVAACDLRVGADNLRLAWPGGRLGVPVGPARLVPLVGLSVAKDLIFTGRLVLLEEAMSLGLVHRSASQEDAESEALRLARSVAAFPPDGLRRLKRLFADLGDTATRGEREGSGLVQWQRHGAGLPFRGRDRT